MSTIELKKKLINRIRQTDNPDLLNEVFRVLEIESENIEIYKLSDEQKKVIDKGREEIKNGKYLSSKDADKEIDEWLKK